MGADFLFYVKSIVTYAPAFLVYNNSVLARVTVLATRVATHNAIIYSAV